MKIVELSLEDLIEVQQVVEKFGTCVFKAKAISGETVWLHVQDQRRRSRRKGNGPQELTEGSKAG